MGKLEEKKHLCAQLFLIVYELSKNSRYIINVQNA
jgi:hypothetical protein